MQKLHKYQRNYCPIVSVMILLGFVCASFSMSPVFADTNTFTTPAASTSVSPTTSTINVTLSDGITIRVLDNTATSDLEDLVFDFTPTDNGVSSTKNAIVEVGTSNETGYTLYMQSDWRKDNTSSTGRYKDNTSEAEFTTSLIHSGATSTPAIEDSIPTRLPSTTPASTSDYPFWYYYNAKDKENKVIPSYGNPDTLAETKEAIEADRTTVPITVGVDTGIVSGTYRNKLVFTATANPLIIDYTVSFDSNNNGAEATSTTGTVTEMPEEDLTASTTASQVSFTLPDEVPYNSGTKVFLGWSEEVDGLNEDGTAATLYQPGETYIDVADTTSGADHKTLYAIWGAPTFWNLHYMQEMSSSVCSNTVYTPSNVIGSSVKLITSEADYTAAADGTAEVPQSTLYDIRDGKSYLVRKLADGNCWMVQDLRLGSTTGTYTLTSNDSNVGNNFTLPISSVEGENWNTTSPRVFVANNGANVFYNWYAATVSAGTSGYSICAKGWRLPNSTGTYSYNNLVKTIYGLANSAAGVQTASDYPISLAIVGEYSWRDSKYSPVSVSSYWTAQRNSAGNYALTLDVDMRTSTSTYLSASIERNYTCGLSVRCVAL